MLPPEATSFDPSGLSDPHSIVPHNGAPADGEATTYYASFVLAAGDPNVVNNHLPLDPFVDGAIHVRKTTPLTTISRGGLVPYTIVVSNTLGSTLTHIDVHDQIPPGFKLVAGSVTLDGLPADPLVQGRELRFPDLTFAPLSERTIKLVLVVGAGVSEGRYVNQAWARHGIADRVLSNVAQAAVRVVADPTLDCSDVIGQVYDDTNANGYQDEGERGVAGVRVVTARGLLVTTDENGRYHVTCADVPNESRGSNFIMKLDTRTLPSGYRVTSENPRVIRLTRGKTSKLNFGVTLSRVARLDLSPLAFEDEGRTPSPALARTLDALIPELAEHPSTLRVAFSGTRADSALARTAFETIETYVAERWRAAGEPYTLPIEREHIELEDGTGQPLSGVFPTEAASPVDGDADRVGFGRNALWLPRGITPPVESVVSAGPGRGSSGAGAPFRVTFDGKGPGPIDAPVDAQRRADVALAAEGLALRFDGLTKERLLSASAWPQMPRRGEAVLLRSSANYAAFIDRAEFRLFADGEMPSGKPLAVVDTTLGETTRFLPEGDFGDALVLVLRVYDGQGHFDETLPVRLPFTERESTPLGAEAIERELLASYGESRLGMKNIPLSGGTVTVSGSAPEGTASIRFLGAPLPVAEDGSFVASQILPAGRHDVDVTMTDASGSSARTTRTLTIPKDDWFFVALADLTVGKSNVNGPAQLVTGDEDLEDDEVFVNGRLAFYLKGKIKGETLLTASVDTREEPLDELLSRLDEKDPRQLLRRLDPDRFYPVYGDDSTAIEDAPTMGRFYVRLERGDSHVLWGNFHTALTATDLAQVDRGLYGLKGRWVSEDQTTFGERRAQVDVFAAEPETVQSLDEFRGTGGSLYHLSHRDITLGSERLRIEVRDRDSGLVLETRRLVANQDYDIDAIQGRIMLTEPLPSTADDGLIVRDGAVDGHHVYLVARYEYAPLFGEVDDMALGGRASGWLGEHLQLGVTSSRQELAGEDQDLHGVDLTVRHSAKTYLKLEAAESSGPGLGENSSLDGGFFFDQGAPVGTSGAEARAYRVEAALDFSDFASGEASGERRGAAQLYWQDQERGFSAPGQLSARATSLWGAAINTPLGQRTELKVKLDSRDEEFGQSTKAANVDLGFRLDESWTLTFGARHDDRDDDNPSAAIVAPDSPYSAVRRLGARTDLGAQLAFKSSEGWDLYGFVQGTLSRDGERTPNNRFGVGGHLELGERLTLGAEASGGNGGLGGKVDTDYRITERTNVYLAYALDTDRSDTGLRGRNGTLSTGVRSRFSETLSVFAEERLLHGEGRSGLTHAFGVDLAPADRWKIGVTGEFGSVRDPLGGELDRKAASVSAGFDGEKLKAASALEGRIDEGAGAERKTWLMRNNVSFAIDEDWRALAKLNFSLSETTQGDFYDGDFTELVLGLAHRPVDNDRWNSLFKYTYFEDVPSPGQLSAQNQRLDYSQKSHVLSADFTFDARPWLSIGGKYGLRISELRPNRVEGDWFESTAQLGVIRLDWHLVRRWDLLVEGRCLDVDLAEDTRTGALLAIYRHFGDHFKLGVGYNFTDFSDDLTDLDYDEKGFFFNVVGKY